MQEMYHVFSSVMSSAICEIYQLGVCVPHNNNLQCAVTTDLLHNYSRTYQNMHVLVAVHEVKYFG